MRLVLLFTLSLFWQFQPLQTISLPDKFRVGRLGFLGTVGHFVNVDFYKSGDDYYEMKKVYSKVSE